MCHPAVVIGFQSLMAVSEYQGGKAQAEAMYDYQLEKQEATLVTAADAARHQYQGIAEQTEQARAAASMDLKNLTGSYMQAEAAGRVGAAAGGIKAKEDNFAMIYQEHHTNRLKNLSWEEAQLVSNARGIQAQHRARAEATAFAPIAGPNPMKMVAQIAASVFTAYGIFPEADMFSGWGG